MHPHSEGKLTTCQNQKKTQSWVLDDVWDWSSEYWYKVAAVEIHDNESLFAFFGPAMLTRR